MEEIYIIVLKHFRKSVKKFLLSIFVSTGNLPILKDPPGTWRSPQKREVGASPTNVDFEIIQKVQGCGQKFEQKEFRARGGGEEVKN